MNVNERGQLAKKRQRWCNSKQAESDSEDSAREMQYNTIQYNIYFAIYTTFTDGKKK